MSQPIKPTMNLVLLAERMGDTATEAEARAMRDLLCDAGYEGQTTGDVPEVEWCQLLSQSVAMASADDAPASELPIANEPQHTRSDMAQTLAARIDAITQLAQDAPTTTYVVRVGQHLYTSAHSSDQLTGIEGAALYRDQFHAQATALHVRNGNNERGQCIPVHQAYDDEIEHLTTMRALIEA